MPQNEPAVCLRAMTADDLPAVAEIERRSFPVPWSEAALRAELGHDYAHLTVAEEAGRVIGYIGLYTVEAEAAAMVTNVAVLPEARGKGVGALLLEAALALAEKAGMERVVLEARRGNAPALRLYARCGFTVLGVRKNAYERPVEDALVLQKQLEGSAL